MIEVGRLTEPGPALRGPLFAISNPVQDHKATPDRKGPRFFCASLFRKSRLDVYARDRKEGIQPRAAASLHRHRPARRLCLEEERLQLPQDHGALRITGAMYRHSVDDNLYFGFGKT